MESTSYFFSEKIGLYDVIIPRETAWDSVNKLSRLNCIHVIEKKTSPTMIEKADQFSDNLKKAEALINKIENIKQDLKQFRHIDESDYKTYPEILEDIDHLVMIRRTQGQLFVNQISDEIIHTEGFLNQQKRDYETILTEKRNIMNQIALLVSISKVSAFDCFKNQNSNKDMDFLQTPDTVRNTIEMKFSYYAGLVKKSEEHQLHKLIFRISKGNALVQMFPMAKQDIKSVIRSQPLNYLDDFSVYLIMHEQGQRNVIHSKIQKILTSTEYYWDIKKANIIDPSHQMNILQSSLVEKCNLVHAIETTTIKRLDYLLEQRPTLKCNNIVFFETFLRRQALIWKTLNTGEVSGNFITLETYIPKKSLQQVDRLSKENGSQAFIVSERLDYTKLPTKFPDTQFMQIPQAIVNTYGIPNVNQMNPAPLYIITFGFFIGVMFGDVGHSIFGIIAMLMLKPNKWWWVAVFWMFYCGIIYNEFFGLNLGWGKSCFDINKNNANYRGSCTYAFGVDPVWKIAENSMGFTNSFKMKFAVIVGVIHMMIGIVIKGINGIRNRNFIDVFAVALPQFLFMIVTFVYMDFLIVVKWLTNYKNPSRAPSIISTMINMALAKEDPNVDTLYPHQAFVEKIIRIAIVVIVPYLLITKPLLLWIRKLFASKSQAKSKAKLVAQHTKTPQQVQQVQVQQNDKQLATDLTSIIHEVILKQEEHHDDHHSMQDIMVHQLIETIEFVLGSVSNTASYLRLWALSLAHVQLSQVFFQMLLQSYFQKGSYMNTIPLFFLFIAFIAVSFGILFCMDTMQCFLHSLRLHWVEFQNKFFAGDGFLFAPLNFSSNIQSQVKI